MEDLNLRKGDAKTSIFGSDKMLQPAPVDTQGADRLARREG